MATLAELCPIQQSNHLRGNGIARASDRLQLLFKPIVRYAHLREILVGAAYPLK